VSLINEALKRARTDAQVQAEAERQGSAPAPAWTPPPFALRERSPVAASLIASLAVSVTVGLGFYFFLHPEAGAPSPAPAVSTAAAAATPTAAPAPDVTPVATTAELPATSPPAAPAARTPNAVPSAIPLEPPVRAPRRHAAEDVKPAAADDSVGTRTAALTTDAVAARADRAPSNAATVGTPSSSAAPAGRRSAGERVPSGETTLPSGAKISLDGIISGAIPLAMLNGRMIGIGEFVGDCALIKIEPRRVQLRCPSGTLWVALP